MPTAQRLPCSVQSREASRRARELRFLGGRCEQPSPAAPVHFWFLGKTAQALSQKESHLLFSQKYPNKATRQTLWCLTCLPCNLNLGRYDESALSWAILRGNYQSGSIHKNSITCLGESHWTFKKKNSLDLFLEALFLQIVFFAIFWIYAKFLK